MSDFVSELTQVIEKHLSATDELISISYEEIPAEQWKDQVFDKEIRPNACQKARVRYVI